MSCPAPLFWGAADDSDHDLAQGRAGLQGLLDLSRPVGVAGGVRRAAEQIVVDGVEERADRGIVGA
ncbi:MAG: hypothetical protein U1E60_31045 [Reyranellaceae bacterium]